MIKNFTFKELIKTDSGLDNIPNDMNIIKNLVKVTEFLQVIRNELHQPIIVTSGYRSEQLYYHVGLPEEGKVPRTQIYTKEVK